MIRSHRITACKLAAGLLLSATLAFAQVYSPKLLGEGQPDSSDLSAFARQICASAHAKTPREKAEAIWRFFLTDGRFANPGFFYHIAGWSYEEPAGEVLDPIKLLNSYGFGLCYHIAPLLEAVFKAGGFVDARCWFLTGHTIAEVFYDRGYYYFDSDMMGYNVPGNSGFRGKAVSSVHDIEQDGSIVLGKLAGPGAVKPGSVDHPWYPADLRAHAIPELAELFTTTADNSVYPFTRFTSGHTMDFVLRKGETLTRFFAPEEPGLFYLPYKFDGHTWSEFPQEVPEYRVRTADGPRSQKDSRTWATGRIDYDPAFDAGARTVDIDMPSPYVIIDARFRLRVKLPSNKSSVVVQTSIDRGGSWSEAAAISGPLDEDWPVEPKVLVKSAHGRLTAVSGTYGYRFRFIRTDDVRVSSLHLTTRFELNPRSLPAIHSGINRFRFSDSDSIERTELPSSFSNARLSLLRVADEHGQRFARPLADQEGSAIYMLGNGHADLTGFDVGARFLDMQDGRAPDKLTAEVRQSSVRTRPGRAGIAWSERIEGPYRELWTYSDQPKWLDGQPISRMLRWPEIARQVRNLPAGTARIYVKFYTAGPAFDNVRLATYSTGPKAAGAVRILQKWHESGTAREHVEVLQPHLHAHDFSLKAGPHVQNDSVSFSCCE